MQQMRAIMQASWMEANISGVNKPCHTASVLAKVFVALLSSTLAAGDALPTGVLHSSAGRTCPGESQVGLARSGAMHGVCNHQNSMLCSGCQPRCS